VQTLVIVGILALKLETQLLEAVAGGRGLALVVDVVLLAADVAKLIAAVAGHMVAAVALLHHHPAARTTLQTELLLQDSGHPLVAAAGVGQFQALRTVLGLAEGACCSLFVFCELAIAVLPPAQRNLGVHQGLLVPPNFLELHLVGGGQGSEVWGVLVEFRGASFVRTLDDLEVIECELDHADDAALA
jgi:hypothetical protein